MILSSDTVVGRATLPTTLHLPSAVRHVGHVEVVEQVVQARRRHVVTKRLQQDAAVAIGKLHLLQQVWPLDVVAAARCSGRDRCLPCSRSFSSKA